MNNDFDNDHGSGFAGGAGRGFAGGSGNGFADSGSDQYYDSSNNHYSNDYSDAPDNGYGNNGYSDSGNFDSPSNNNFGGNNFDNPSNNNFGGSNFESPSNNNFSGNNFGGTLNNSQPDYDPNAPLYQPDYDPNAPLYQPDYDPNAPLYHPTSTPSYATSSVTAAARTKSKNQTLIIVIAIVLVALIVGGVLVYKMMFEKRSIREYMESAEGKLEYAQIQARYKAQNPELKSLEIKTEGDDALIYELQYDVVSISGAQRQGMQAALEMMRSTVQSEIHKVMDQFRIREYKITFRYLNKNGGTMIEYTIDP